MPILTRIPSGTKVILRDVSWRTYQSLLKDLENCSSPHIAYDHGVMEILSPHAAHEDVKYLVSSIIESTLEELDLDFRNLGSMTFKRNPLQRGFEPDSCFYISSVDKIRNRRKIDLETDPPADLIVEIDLTNDSLDKIPIYTSIRIPEVWRFTDSLEILVLKSERYVRRPASSALPLLTAKFVTELVFAAETMKRPAWLRYVRHEILQLIDSF